MPALRGREFIADLRCNHSWQYENARDREHRKRTDVRVIGYVRVSTDRQAEKGLGPAVQEWRYDLKLWIGHLFEGATYLPS